MSLQFYLGASGSGKSYNLYLDIVKKAKENPDRNYLFLVPDQFTMQAQIDLVNATPNKGIMNIDVLSFGRLSHRIFEETGYSDKTVLDDTGKSLILRKIATGIESNMPVLGSRLNKVGYIHEIKSVISEFKQYDIKNDDLKLLIDYSEKNAMGMLGAKIRDLAFIYSEFNDYTCNDYITKEETLGLLIDALPYSKIIKDAVVVLDGFTGFTPVQYRLIQRLMELTNQVIVSVTIDPAANPYGDINEEELFCLSKKTIHDLQKCAAEVNVALDEDRVFSNGLRFTRNPELDTLEKSLFRYPGIRYEKEVKTIDIFEAPKVDSEVKNTCYQIKRLVLEEGYEYRDIAVVCGDLEGYSDLFKHYAKVYDIPVFIDQNKKLILNPFVEFIKSALAVVKEDFTYRSVFHMLRSGMAPFSSEETDYLDNYVLAFGISGKKKYSELFTKVQNISGIHSKDGTIQKEDMDHLNLLNSLRSRLMDLLEPLLVKCTTVGDYVNALTLFIDNANVKEGLEEYACQFAKAGQKEKESEYLRVYDLITELLDKIKGILGDEATTVEEFIKLLEAGIDEIDVGNIPGSVDRVIIGDIIRTRVGSVKVLFFTGVNDGNIPKANLGGGIISDYDREFLKNTNIELSPTPRQQMFTQRLYLYMNMTKPSHKLIVSYSKASRDNKSLKESYIIPMLRKIFPKINVKMTDITQKPFDTIMGINDGISVFSQAIREYSEGNLSILSNKELISLSKVLKDSKEKELYEKLLNTAFFEYKPVALTPSVAKALYGAVLSNSVSRLEKFYACEYAHFLSYGMKLAKREEYEFEDNDLGSVYHAVLEGFADKVAKAGYTLLDYPEDIAPGIIDEVLQNVSVNHSSSILYSSNSMEHRIELIGEYLTRSITTLTTQLRGSLFEPDCFEKSFSIPIKIDDDTTMNLNGRIDRIDICKDKDKLYIKVLDYKKGDSDIDFESILYGLSIQQPVYMKAAIDMMTDKYPELIPTMAGMMYFKIDNPLIDDNNSLSDDKLEEKLLDSMRPTGLVSDDTRVLECLDKEFADKKNSFTSHILNVSTKADGSFSKGAGVISPEEYAIIGDFIDKSIVDAGRKITEGNIAVNPYKYNSKCSCTYCDYKSICPFDEREAGFEYRELPSYEKEEVLERMKSCR